MANIQFFVELDLIDKYVPAEDITVVQESFQSVEFFFDINKNGSPVDLTGATDFVFALVKPDGHVVLQNDAKIENKKVKVVVNPEAFTAKGKIFYQMQYKIGSAVYNTRQAFAWVEKGNTSCQSLKSTDYAPFLDQSIELGKLFGNADNVTEIIASPEVANSALAQTNINTDEICELNKKLETTNGEANGLAAKVTNNTNEISTLSANKADETYVDSELLKKSNQTYVDNELAKKASQSELTVKADKTYVDTKVASVASGSPKGAYATLANLQSAKPTGDANIYVVTADGKWYYWNGTAWLAGGVYQSAGVSDYSILRRKLTNYKKDDNYNLIDTEDITTGGYYNASGVFVGNAGWGVTSALQITPGIKYYYAYCSMTYFDSNLIFISQASGTITTPPANAVYVIASIQVANYNKAFIQKGIVGVNIPPKYSDNKFLVTNENIEDLLSLDNGRYFKRIRTSNLFDKSKTITSGYFNSSGAFVSSTTANSTDFIRVVPGSTYSHIKAGNIQFWDDNLSFISNITPGASPFVIPAGATLLTAQFTSTNKDGVAIALGSTIKYEGYYDYRLDTNITASSSKLKFKNWNALGDSLTKGAQHTPSGYMYMKWIEDWTGVNHTNYGISGTAIAKRPDMPEWDSNAMSVRYTEMSNNADYITVFGGTNDIGSVVGTMENRTPDTLYGACHVLFLGLLAKYPGKKIGVITPIRYFPGDTSRLQIVNVMKEVASYYNLPVCDLYNTFGMLPTMNDEIKAMYCPDGLHLNEEGHKFLATKVQMFMESL